MPTDQRSRSTYRLISSDGHIVEPPDVWVDRVPHISADWPYSWRTIQASMAGVPRDERDLMLAGNAQRLYKFGQ